MASLREIRRKIKSVKSTQQITKAMNPPSLKLRRAGMACPPKLAIYGERRWMAAAQGL